MIHFHGLPITPGSSARAAINTGHGFVSFAHPEQLGLALEVCQTFAIDNGAFSAWKSGKPIEDWEPYYQWVAELHRYPSFDFAVIPDVIDGDENANDLLLTQWPWVKSAPWIGAPVWHLHESLERLELLASTFPRICIGSSGEYAQIGTPNWWNRMAETFNQICDKSGRPICKVHGLRMLDPKVFTCFPFSSVDSTNIARNIGIDKAWNGSYSPPSKDCRALVMRSRIEAFNGPTFWKKQATALCLF
jgi:hypothetical protein